MSQVIHSKTKQKSAKPIPTRFPAIVCALATLLTPVIPVIAASSTYATSTSKGLSFSVEVSSVPFLELDMNDTFALQLEPKANKADFYSGDFSAYVTTTNTAGYNLTMRANPTNSDNENKLVSDEGYAIAPLMEDATNHPEGLVCSDSTVGTAACTFTDNSWGYKTSSDTGYFAMPYGNSSISIGHSGGVASHEASTVAFAAKVDHTQHAGSYRTTIEFMLTANVAYACSADTVCYNYNVENQTSPTTMAPQQIYTTVNDVKTYEDTTTLWASNFQRAGYGFLGWNTQSDGSGTMYGPNQTLTAEEQTLVKASGLPLYAIWLEESSQYTMQTFTDAVCKANLVKTTVRTEEVGGNTTVTGFNVSPRSVIALRDERDNQVYAVARLADGNCWMIENLRLDNSETYASTTQEFTPNNTHNPSLPITNIYGSSTSNRLTSSSNSTWCTNNSANCINQSMLNTENTNQASGTTFNGSSNMANYSYGNYYNWYSATAGNGTYSIAVNNTDIDGDLCPVNWKLPTGGDSITKPNITTTSDFYKLFYSIMGGEPNINGQYGSYYDGATAAPKAARLYPNNYVISGYANINGFVYNRSGISQYWASTAANAQSSYLLYLGRGILFPGTNTNQKAYGSAVRCLAGN